jgi:hypothetical protein
MGLPGMWRDWNFEFGMDGLVGYIKECIGYFPEDL